jgi:hypothetical protein
MPTAPPRLRIMLNSAEATLTMQRRQLVLVGTAEVAD